MTCYIAGVDVEWPLMKVIITFTFCCDNLQKSKFMALEKPGNLREFFSPTLWPPCFILPEKNWHSLCCCMRLPRHVTWYQHHVAFVSRTHSSDSRILSNFYASAFDRYWQRHYVFRLCVCEYVSVRECVWAWVLKCFLARYVKKHWMEFHQTLVDGVVEALGELIRFWRSWVYGQGRYKISCEKLCYPISSERLEGLWSKLTQIFYIAVRWTDYLLKVMGSRSRSLQGHIN